MNRDALKHRLATRRDLPALKALMALAIDELQKPFLSDAEIISSRAIMGLDTQLIDDGTYFVIESGDQIVGCGGWSKRATLYGSDQSPGRDASAAGPGDRRRARARHVYPSRLYTPRDRPVDS